jgi:GntR family transcriptional repressor for pyruvate dehydrogenase complex
MTSSSQTLPDVGDGSRLYQQLARRLLADLAGGRYAVGDRLPPERELAQTLNVNRSSVREALKKLEQLRLVDIQQGSGTRVKDSQHASFEVVWEMLFEGGRPNLARIRDLLELREALLPGVLRLALERASDEELGAGVTELRRAADPELSGDEFLSALRDLQVVLARLTHNRVLVILANTLTRFLAERGLRRDLLALAADRPRLRPLLARLAVAMEARDVETAERAARELLKRISKQALAALAVDPAQTTR